MGWQQTTQAPTDGAISFMNNCARCHTRGWSYFDPSNPEANPPPGIMGGGAYGPNLTGGDVNNQFPPPTGEHELMQWISIGVPANEAVRHPRHLVGTHAALRRRAHQGADRRRSWPTSDRCRSGDDVPLNFAAALGHQEHLVPDDPRRARRGRRDRALLRLDLLLLGTNLGARLGFLVPFTGAHGVPVILSVLWLTTASPLESLKGRVASWKAIENVPDLTKAKTVAVRDIEQKQNKAVADRGVQREGRGRRRARSPRWRTPTVQVTPNDNRFAKFADVTQFMVLKTYDASVGAIRSSGRASSTTRRSTPWSSTARQPTQTQTFGLPPLPPECASGADAQQRVRGGARSTTARCGCRRSSSS